MTGARHVGWACVVLVACGAPEGEIARIVPVDGDPVDAKVGALASRPLEVRVVSSDGMPIPGVEIAWSPVGDSGWVFPAGPSDDQGVARASWVPDRPAAQSVIVTSSEGASAELSRQVTASENRANSVHLWYETEPFTGFRVEIEPTTTPLSTYYAALGWEGGYAGLQPGRVLFSVWDVDASSSARILDEGVSSCNPFGGEGTGIQCWHDYAWTARGRYEFELLVEPAQTSTDFSVYLTDMAAGSRLLLARLRYAAQVTNDYAYSFAEDFGPPSASCLDTDHRSVTLRRAAYRDVLGWHDVQSATFTQYHPRTTCANVYAAAVQDGFVLATGGEVVGNPTADPELRLP